MGRFAGGLKDKTTRSRRSVNILQVEFKSNRTLEIPRQALLNCIGAVNCMGKTEKTKIFAQISVEKQPLSSDHFKHF